MNPMYITLIFVGIVMFATAAIAVAVILRRDPLQGLSNNANAVALAKNGIVYAAKGDGVYYANTVPAPAGNNCNQPTPAGNINNFYFNSASTGDNRPADAETKNPAPKPETKK